MRSNPTASLLIAGSISLFCAGAVRAEEKHIDPRDLALVIATLEKQAKLLLGFEELEYSMKREILSKPKEERFSVRYSLTEARDGRFRCSWLQTLADGSEIAQSAAFDGATYQVLERDLATCFLSAGLPPINRFQLPADEFATSPFWYLYDSPKEQNYYGGPSLDRLLSKDTLAALLKKVQSVNVTDYLGEKMCQVVLVTQVDRWGKSVVRRVQLRIEDGFPLVTESVDPSGRLTMRYAVESVGWALDEKTKARFPFPAVARGQLFTPPKKANAAPELAAEYSYKIDHCTLNGQTPVKYSFDLTGMEKIYDETAKTLIKVPK